MRSPLTIAAAATAILASAAHPAASQEQVGQATLIRTTVTGGAGPLVVKSPVHRDERIRTSNSGLGEFMFRDGTRFAVGRNSSVVIDRFVYDGARTFNKLTLNAARGSFRWISGKSKSEAYEIVTPAGTIGVRGTRFDIFIGAGGITSVVLLDGSARFCGANGCRDLRPRASTATSSRRSARTRLSPSCPAGSSSRAVFAVPSAAVAVFPARPRRRTRSSAVAASPLDQAVPSLRASLTTTEVRNSLDSSSHPVRP